MAKHSKGRTQAEAQFKRTQKAQRAIEGGQAMADCRAAPEVWEPLRASRREATQGGELAVYEAIGRQFVGHGTIHHKSGEYTRHAEGIRAAFYHTNTVECFFSLCKRAVFGAHHSVSEAHLPRYLTEWDFKWNTRKVSDKERAALALKGIEGKRLTYRIPNGTSHA
jgi:hypothetical protein